MANTIGYGQGAVNNTNSWGQGAKIGSSFSNLQSTEYDGVDDNMQTNAIYSELDGQTKATFSMWIKPNLDSTDFALYVSSASDRAYTIVVYNTGQLRMQMQSSGLYVTTNTGVLTANVWQHITICIDLSLAFSNRGAIFVNGADVTSGNNLNLTSFVTSNGKLTLGGPIIFYGGKIDEVAIYSGTDLRNDVSTLYNSGLPNDLNNNGLTAPTTYYRFEGTGTTVSDIGSNTNDATLLNGVTRSSDVPT